VNRRISRTDGPLGRKGTAGGWASVEFVACLIAILIPSVLLMSELAKVMVGVRNVFDDAQPKCIALAASAHKTEPHRVTVTVSRSVSPQSGTKRVFRSEWRSGSVGLRRSYSILAGSASE